MVSLTVAVEVAAVTTLTAELVGLAAAGTAAQAEIVLLKAQTASVVVVEVVARTIEEMAHVVVAAG
jgi:hypothetical protein